MASIYMAPFCRVVLISAFFSSLHFLTVKSVDFQVGNSEGWAVPPSKNDQIYNDWASHNRFNVNDTLHFKYKKDSVLVVSKEEYEKCRSPHPLFFSNNGHTSFTLERAGLFYFISGVAGHCERGLKMIIKVLEPPAPPQPPNQPSEPSSQNSGAAPACTASYILISPTLMLFTISLLVVFLVQFY